MYNETVQYMGMYNETVQYVQCVTVYSVTIYSVMVYSVTVYSTYCAVDADDNVSTKVENSDTSNKS